MSRSFENADDPLDGRAPATHERLAAAAWRAHVVRDVAHVEKRERRLGAGGARLVAFAP